MESMACLKMVFVLLVQAIACDCDADGGVQLQLLLSRAVWMILCFHAVVESSRGYACNLSLRKSNSYML